MNHNWVPPKRFHVACFVFSVVFAERWWKFYKKDSAAICSMGISPSERGVLFLWFSRHELQNWVSVMEMSDSSWFGILLLPIASSISTRILSVLGSLAETVSCFLNFQPQIHKPNGVCFLEKLSSRCYCIVAMKNWQMQWINELEGVAELDRLIHSFYIIWIKQWTILLVLHFISLFCIWWRRGVSCLPQYICICQRKCCWLCSTSRRWVQRIKSSYLCLVESAFTQPWPWNTFFKRFI